MFRMISYIMISSNRYENILSHIIHGNHFLHINGIQAPKGGIIGTDTCTFIQRSGNFRRKNSFYTEGGAGVCSKRENKSVQASSAIFALRV